jgi:hypothetical protein
MTAPAGDALSHENLLRSPAAFFSKVIRRSRIATADVLANTSLSPGQTRSARICMAAMSGTNRRKALHLTITWTQLPAPPHDFIFQ